MIVELFGPPGVGKTTFASALAAHLRERGQIVDPVMSYRPAEQAPGSAIPASKQRRSVAAMQRLTRPVAEMLATAGHLWSHSNDFAATTELMRLLPTRDLIWSIRLRQYLFRLFRSWHIASASPHVVLFDQAFVQAVCSLALLTRAPERARVERALDAVSNADMLIQLDAPRDILAARLGKRQQRQGRIERLLEFDLATNLASVEILEDLRALLQARSRPITRLECVDQPTLRSGVAQAGADILARLAARSAPGWQAAKWSQHA